MPTTIRSTGLHACSISARVGAFLAPYLVAAANNYSYYLLNSLFLMLCAGAVLLTWGLPETKDTTLQTTLQSADHVTSADHVQANHVTSPV